MSEGQRLTSGLGEKSISQNDYSPVHAIHGDAATANTKINASIRYGNSAHMRNPRRRQFRIQTWDQTAADRDNGYY